MKNIRIKIKKDKSKSNTMLDKNTFPKINQNNNLNNKRKDNIDDIFYEEKSLLQNFWDELSVKNEFRNYFLNYIEKINSIEEGNKIITNEITNLEKLRDSLNSLKEEIISRKINIKSLKKYDNDIKNYKSKGNVMEKSSSVFKDIFNIINELRYNAIKIVQLINIINKIILSNKEKWDMNKIHKEYLYEPDYINKMKEELQFLKDSTLSEYIEMNNTEIDPFLTNCAPLTGKNNSNKLTIPINESLKKAINDSKYLIKKEYILSDNYMDSNKIINISDIHLNTEADFNNTDNTNTNKNNNKTFKISISSKNNKNIKKLRKNRLSGNFNFKIDREIFIHKKEFGNKIYNEIFYTNSPLYSSIGKKPKIKLEYAEMNNLLLNEKNKNKDLNNEIIQLKKRNIDNKKKYIDLKILYDKLNNDLNKAEQNVINKENDISNIQIKLRDKNNENQRLLEEIKKNSRKDINYENENEIIKELEQKLKDKEIENQNYKNEIEKKDEEILKLKNEINILKSKLSIDKYKVDFYRDNISDLINYISDKSYSEKIPDFFKRAFSLDETIYTDEFYLKGLFPKIIISKNVEENNNINGVCSMFYENNENEPENLILRINYIYAIEDWENSIITMINYIKANMKFDQLIIYLLYDKIDNKLIPNQEAINIFQNKLDKFGFMSLNINEEKNKKYIKLYYTNSEEEEKEKKDNNINENKNNFILENFTIITLNNEQNIDLLKSEIDNEVNKENNIIKFINQNSIFSLLYENPKLNIEFSKENQKNEIKEMKEKLKNYITNEYNWNNLDEEKKEIKNININIENSLFKRMEKLCDKNNTNNNRKYICDLQKRNLLINFETIYSVLINDDIYYNRISSKNINISRDNITNSLYFLIPSKDNSILFYLSEINDKLSELLIDIENKNYEQFLEFQQNIQKILYQFRESLIKETSNIQDSNKKEKNIIYIPTFLLKNHLYSYNLNKFIENININNKENNEKLYLNSVDEFINIEFKPDDNIKNCFSIQPVEDDLKKVIIKNSFVVGIFKNDIMGDEKLPLIDFIYVKKENFLTKNNYLLK